MLGNNDQDQPLVLTRSDYERAYGLFEDYCKSFDSVLYVGRFGEVNDPPISDLDVIVGLQDCEAKATISRLVDFISGDPVLKYVFAHPPVFVVASSGQFLNRLHTLNGLSLTYNPAGVAFHDSQSDYVDLLNSVWASYVLVAAAEILANPETFTARYALMVLKNIQQSIVNFGGENQVLDHSRSIRGSYVEGETTYDEIVSEINSFLSLMLMFVDKINGKKNNNISRKSYRLSLMREIVLCDQSRLFVNGGFVKINISHGLFLLFDYMYRTSACKAGGDIAAYKNAYFSSASIYKRLEITYPFISPFAYDFFPVNTMGMIRKKFLSFL